MKTFLANCRAQNYKELVEMLWKSLLDVGAKMSIKVYFLHSHQNIFSDNCGNVSDEQSERFHQDIKTMEERYRGRRDKQIMADYFWSIKRDLHNSEHDNRDIFIIVLMFTMVLFRLLIY